MSGNIISNILDNDYKVQYLVA